MNIFLEERCDRPRVLSKYLKTADVSLDQANHMIQLVWEDAEFPEQQARLWQRLLARYSSNHAITEPLQVYRGGTTSSGYAWTTDIDMARWFAKRTLNFEQAFWRNVYDLPYGLGSKVFSAQVNPNAIVFTTNERNENEVVVATWRKTAWAVKPQILESL
jgi:hypothetical protein